MNRLDIINAINNYNFNNSVEIIDIMNQLFSSGAYKIYLDVIKEAISATQLYGFLAYLDKNEIEEFLDWDYLRSRTYKGKQIPFYNSGQLSLIYEIEKYKKIFFSAPTSFGKTSLVLDYIISNYNLLKNILFIVPTNSLLEELYVKMVRVNKNNSLNYNVSTQPYFYNDKNNFIILTPERFLIMCEEVVLTSFDLIVMDETYKIVDSRNEIISDFVESRAVRFRKVADMIGKDAKKLILLSPFTYTLTDSMSNYLNKYGISKIDRQLEYVKRNIYKIDDSDSFRKHFNIKMFGYQKSISISKKVNLLLRVLNGEKNIVYVSRYADSYRIIDDIDWESNNSYNKRYIDFINHLEKNYSIDDTSEWKIITALKKGIGIYISPLPRYIKKEIINLYNENILHTLIVTTAFTEGVNTNACNLIFTSLYNGRNTNKLTDIDVLNAAGRAGRFAQKSIGNIYCISSEIYNRVEQLQNTAEIKLENYNYYTFNDHKRIDYEIDMIDDEYLSEEEKTEKQQINDEIVSLGLSSNDLKLSLNVSTKWKLCLYKYLMNNKDKVSKLFTVSENLLSNQPNSRLYSLKIVFDTLKEAFDDANIIGFPCEPYEIKPFDKANNFVWGRLYQVYCSGNISRVIKNNMLYVKKQYDFVKEKYNLFNATHVNFVKEYFAYEGLSWILKYYHSDLTINFNAFYSETFKFISNIIQYKIPFYTSYFVSILKLFISKNFSEESFNLSKLDTKKITLLFEDGSVFDDYSRMMDYGLPNDLIVKLSDNQITMNNIKEKEFETTLFDNYENTLIEEFINIL